MLRLEFKFPTKNVMLLNYTPVRLEFKFPTKIEMAQNKGAKECDAVKLHNSTTY